MVTLFYLKFNNSIAIANYLIAVILLVLIFCIVLYFILLINFGKHKSKIIGYPKSF